MSYQTRVEVNRAAKQSEKTAIKSGIRHWKEISTAPLKELLENELLFLTANNCALCGRYWNRGSCRGCPLNRTGENCFDFDTTYNQADEEYRYIVDAPTKSLRDATVKRFRRRAKKMVKVLESLL